MSSISGINSVMSGSSMISRSADLFKKLDTSGDGGIDFDEFKAGAPKDGKGGPGGLSQEDMFKQIDTNGDNTIDKDEQESFLKLMEERRNEQRSSIQSYADDGKGKGTTSSLFSVLA